MSENPELLQALKSILYLRKNNQYFAEKLGASLEDVEWAREELKKQGYIGSKMTKDSLGEADNAPFYYHVEGTEIPQGTITTSTPPHDGSYWNIKTGENNIVESISDREKGTDKITFFHTSEALTDEEVYLEAKKDSKDWFIAQIWHLKKSRGFLHSVLFKPIHKEDSPENFQQNFINYLSGYIPNYIPVEREKKFYGKRDAVMVIPKQDFHFDKHDMTGNNDVVNRQDKDSSITEYFVEKASSFYNLKKVYYVLGSDYFNAEYTKTTTKGTPQQNAISSYHISFELACLHEQFIIKQLLRSVGEVEVIFIAGNHDYYVGWHLVTWLKAYFKGEKRVSINPSPDLDKCITAFDTAVMLRHGNDIKPQALANIFSAKYRKEWANANHTYIITGDKHTEKSGDYGSTRHYQVPALSSAKSLWDQNNGYTITRTEHSAFIIEEGKGISDLFREYNQ